MTPRDPQSPAAVAARVRWDHYSNLGRLRMVLVILDVITRLPSATPEAQEWARVAAEAAEECRKEMTAKRLGC